MNSERFRRLGTSVITLLDSIVHADFESIASMMSILVVRFTMTNWVTAHRANEGVLGSQTDYCIYAEANAKGRLYGW